MARDSVEADRCRAVRSGSAGHVTSSMAIEVTTAIACRTLDAGNCLTRFAAALTDRVPQDTVNHATMNIRQAEVATGVAVRQTRVVEAQDVQNRRVEIVNVDGVFRDVVADLVRRSVDDARLDAASGQPAGKR